MIALSFDILLISCNVPKDYRIKDIYISLLYVISPISLIFRPYGCLFMAWADTANVGLFK